MPVAPVAAETCSRGDAENIDQSSRRTHHSFGMVCVHSTGVGTVGLPAVLSMAYAPVLTSGSRRGKHVLYY